MNRDPIAEKGGINLYGFVGNSPITRIDPFGNDWLDHVISWWPGDGIGYEGDGNWTADPLPQPIDPDYDPTDNLSGGTSQGSIYNPGDLAQGKEQAHLLQNEVVWGVLLLPVGGPGLNLSKDACSSLRAAQLSKHLRQLEKYGTAGFKELQNGRIRYIGKLREVSKRGIMAGQRTVREWDPSTGATKTWMETIDHAGRIRIVRPETGKEKIHFLFDEFGNFIGTF